MNVWFCVSCSSLYSPFLAAHFRKFFVVLKRKTSNWSAWHTWTPPVFTQSSVGTQICDKSRLRFLHLCGQLYKSRSVFTASKLQRWYIQWRWPSFSWRLMWGKHYLTGAVPPPSAATPPTSDHISQERKKHMEEGRKETENKDTEYRITLLPMS